MWPSKNFFVRSQWNLVWNLDVDNWEWMLVTEMLVTDSSLARRRSRPSVPHGLFKTVQILAILQVNVHFVVLCTSGDICVRLRRISSISRLAQQWHSNDNDDDDNNNNVIWRCSVWYQSPILDRYAQRRELSGDSGCIHPEKKFSGATNQEQSVPYFMTYLSSCLSPQCLDSGEEYNYSRFTGVSFWRLQRSRHSYCCILSWRKNDKIILVSRPFLHIVAVTTLSTQSRDSVKLQLLAQVAQSWRHYSFYSIL